MGSVPEGLAQEIRDRDGGCVLCATTKDEASLHVHHKIPEEEGGKTVPENLITLCKSCHHQHHRSGVADGGIADIDPDNYDQDLTNVDQDIIGVCKQHGPSSVGKLIDTTGATGTYVRNRVRYLWAHGVLSRSQEGTYGLPADVESPAKGTLPDESYTAFLLGRDEMLRRLSEASVDTDDVLEAVGLSSDSVDRALNRVAGWEPPIDENWHRGRDDSVDCDPVTRAPPARENESQQNSEQGIKGHRQPDTPSHHDVCRCQCQRQRAQPRRQGTADAATLRELVQMFEQRRHQPRRRL
ncbi:HNH endonuclease [Halobaculum sp. MBLA0147]|uniref:HNH endonuclease n=1 Tax=Halobaculum sp. MBLA0147 TaxID=3079934 RepID=UPI003523188C